MGVASVLLIMQPPAKLQLPLVVSHMVRSYDKMWSVCISARKTKGTPRYTTEPSLV